MRHAILAGALALATMSFNAAPAQAYQGRWCAVHSMGRNGAYWECQFQTLEQCLPWVIAGNRGFCNRNPAYADEEPAPRRIAKRRHHRRHVRR